MSEIFVDGKSLTLTDVVNVARYGAKIALRPEALADVAASRAYIEQLLDQGRKVYGISTGFGEFAKVAIQPHEMKQLQRNLIVSHACGVGQLFSDEVVRAIMLLRINALSIGYSGIRAEVLQTLVDMLNAGVHPVIPEKGSLGASGDLAPLAHMALPLIGLGEARYNGEYLPGAEAMAKACIATVELAAKEGLALINGTQVMCGVGALVVHDAKNLMMLADISAALSMEALNGIVDAYNPALHALRPHQGQMDTAADMLKLLEGSQRTTRQGQKRIQDAYSLRCVPQIHGASKDALCYVEQKLLVEINSVTDNPIILPDEDAAISSGNFHGQPMALAFDFLGIALSEIANVSERRIERLVNPVLSGLPAFLTQNGGLNSGYMIAQYSAASLVSENKVLAHPASVDSIASSAGQEDHVSMGTIAARKAAEILFNAKRVVGIELAAACQAIDLGDNDKTLGKGTGAAYDIIRKVVPKLEDDRELYVDFEKMALLIDAGIIEEAVWGKI
ncbi:MAG: histidine ammonia-lyase [Clostridiales bacterium]|jgi:histidine ammonia-lyase|nr:histidine ammonia-lyase [Clostridiales bacterium]